MPSNLPCKVFVVGQECPLSNNMQMLQTQKGQSIGHQNLKTDTLTWGL